MWKDADPRTDGRPGVDVLTGKKSYRNWLIALALLGVILDQTSKYGVFSWLYHSPRYNAAQGAASYEVFDGAFRLYVQFTDAPAGSSVFRNWGIEKQPRVNHGALFGLFNDRESGANT